jgi:hypothetical protein
VAANAGYGPAIQAILDQMNASGPAAKAKYDLPSNFKDKAPGGVLPGGNKSNGVPEKGGKNESNFHKVLDFLGRSGAATAGGIEGGFAPGNKGFLGYDAAKFTKGIQAGLSGETHHNFKEVEKQHGYTGTGAGTLGVLGDVFLDPTTYAGGIGLAGKAGKAARLAEAASKGEKISKASKVGDILKAVNPVNPAKIAGAAVADVGKLKNLIIPAKAAPVDISSKLAALKALGDAPKIAANAAGPADSAIADLGKIAKSTPQLPKNLSGAASRYGGFGVNRTVKFPDDVTKSLYVIAGKTVSKSHDKYMDFLRSALPHLDDTAIKSMGNEVRDSLKAQAKVLPKDVKHIDATAHSAVAPQAAHIATPTAAAFAPRSLNDLLPAERAELDAAVAAKRMDANRATFDKSFDHKAYHNELMSGIKNTVPYSPANNITMKMIRSDPALFNGVGSNLGVKNSIAYKRLNAANVSKLQAQELAKLNDADRVVHESANHLASTPSVPTVTPSPVEQILAAHPDAAGVAPSTAAARLAATQEALTPREAQIASANAQRFMGVIGAGKGVEGTFNAAKQVNLRSAIADDVMQTTKGGLKKRLTPEQQAKITRIYNHAEAMVEHNGHSAVLEDGTKARLSNILPHLTPKEIVNGDHLTQVMNGTATTEIGQGLHAAMLAAAHVEDVNKVRPIMDDIEQLIRSNGTVKAINAAAVGTDSVVHAAQMAEASPEAVNAVKSTLTHGVAEELPHVDAMIKSKAVDPLAVASNTPSFAAGKMQIEGAERYLGIKLGVEADSPLIRLIPATKIAKGVKSAVGLGERDALGKLTIKEDRNFMRLNSVIAKGDHVVNTVFSTGYNKPAGLEDASRQILNATNSYIVEARDALSQLKSATTLDERSLSWEKAKAGDLTDAHAADIHARMDNLLGPDGMLNNLKITPGELEPHMKSVFRGMDPAKMKGMLPLKATDSSIKSDANNIYDSWRHGSLPEGTRWADPAAMLLGLESAVQKAAGMKLTMQHAGTHLGMELAKAPEDWQLVKTAGGTLDDVRFPPEIAPALGKFFNSFHPANHVVIRAYDTLLRGFKIALTKYFPGHHINNSLGQLQMAAQADGLYNFNYYRRGLAVVRDHAALDPKLLGMSVEPSGLGKTAFKFQGQSVNNSEAWRYFTHSGARQAHAATNELGGDPNLLNSVSNTVQHFSDARENMHRISHFMFLIEKDTTSKTIDEAVAKAGARVNEVHADYSNLTDIEKNFMRRIIPFYTWQRRMAPVMFKQTFTNPGRVLVLPKIYRGIGQNNGEEQSGQGFFPSPQDLLPSYLQDLLQIKIPGLPGNLTPGGYGGIRNPYADVIGKTINKPSSILDGVTPALKVPFELKSGHSLYSGAPIGPKATYIGDQIPVLSVAQRLLRHNLLGAPTKDPTKNPDQQGPDPQALQNFLTGIPIKPVTSSITAAAQKEQNSKRSPGLGRVAKVGKVRVAR